MAMAIVYGHIGRDASLNFASTLRENHLCGNCGDCALVYNAVGGRVISNCARITPAKKQTPKPLAQKDRTRATRERTARQIK
jgi:hypothetical protein